MTARDLLSDLRRLGVTLWAEGTRLRFRAPRGVLRAGDEAALSACRVEILRLLADGTEDSAEAVAATPPSVGSPPCPQGREEALDALYGRILSAPAIARCPGGCGREVVWSDSEADPGICFDCGTDFVPVGPPESAGGRGVTVRVPGGTGVGQELGAAPSREEDAPLAEPGGRPGVSDESATREAPPKGPRPGSGDAARGGRVQ